MVYGMTQAEEAEFRSCERVISRGAKDFYPVGRALARIQSARLYRVQYATFTDYCQDRWGFSRIRAYQLISASERYELLKGVDVIPLPKNESQLRALMKVPEQDIEQVWRDFISGHGKGDVRAKHVETFVKERYGNLPRRKRGRGKGGKQCENLSVPGNGLRNGQFDSRVEHCRRGCGRERTCGGYQPASQRLRRQAAAKSLRRLNVFEC